MTTRLRNAIGLLFFAGWLWGDTTHSRADDIETAKQLIASQSIDKAVEILRWLVTQDPKDADAQLLLGTSLALAGHRSESIEALQRTVELRPESAQVRLSLGMVLARFGEHDRARQAYEKAAQLDPKLTMAHANLAVMLAADGKLDAAVAEFTQAIELEGEPATAARYHYLRGKVYRQQNLSEKAVKDFEKAVALQPGYGRAYLDLGITRSELQNDGGALEAFQKAVEFAPRDGEARYQLGSQYLRAGRVDQAVTELEAASRLQPDDRNVVLALIRALRAAGRTEEARPLTERLAQSAKTEAFHDPDEVKAGELNNEGVALEKEGKFTDALEKYRAAVALRPRETDFRRNLALVLCRLERWQEAVVQLKEVLALSPGDGDANKALYIALDKVEVKR